MHLGVRSHLVLCTTLFSLLYNQRWFCGLPRPRPQPQVVPSLEGTGHQAPAASPPRTPIKCIFSALSPSRPFFTRAGGSLTEGVCPANATAHLPTSCWGRPRCPHWDLALPVPSPAPALQPQHLGTLTEHTSWAIRDLTGVARISGPSSGAPSPSRHLRPAQGPTGEGRGRSLSLSRSSSSRAFRASSRQSSSTSFSATSAQGEDT